MVNSFTPEHFAAVVNIVKAMESMGANIKAKAARIKELEAELVVNKEAVSKYLCEHREVQEEQYSINMDMEKLIKQVELVVAEMKDKVKVANKMACRQQHLADDLYVSEHLSEDEAAPTPMQSYCRSSAP